MNSIKVVGVVTIIVFIFIYFVTNQELRKEILKVFEIGFGKKKKVKIKNLIFILSMVIIILYSTRLLLKSNKVIDLYIEVKNEESVEEEENEIANNQVKRYRELMKLDTNIQNCKNPYIPDGFKHIDGEWIDGFVIEDSIGNQFVWVPCINTVNKMGIPFLKRDKFGNTSSNYFKCYEQPDYEDFLISCLENGGFYISRFEIGNEENKPVSKKDVPIWTNVNYEEAKELSESMYSGINSKLINGYAYDTAVNFIYDEVDLNDISKTTGITGTKSYKHIYDLIDDMLEWSSEERDFINLKRGSIFYLDSIYFLADRFPSDGATDKLGFRTIIYK